MSTTEEYTGPSRRRSKQNRGSLGFAPTSKVQAIVPPRMRETQEWYNKEVGVVPEAAEPPTREEGARAAQLAKSKKAKALKESEVEQVPPRARLVKAHSKTPALPELNRAGRRTLEETGAAVAPEKESVVVEPAPTLAADAFSEEDRTRPLEVEVKVPESPAKGIPMTGEVESTEGSVEVTLLEKAPVKKAPTPAPAESPDAIEAALSQSSK